MRRKRHNSLLLFVALLLLSALACQAATTLQPVTEIDRDAVVREAVATIEARTATVAPVDPGAPAEVTDVSAEAVRPTEAIEPESSLTAEQLFLLGGTLEAAMIDIYQRVNDSVVSIFVFGEIDNFGAALGSGSGFIYDNDGHIVTNNHVVTEARNLEVVFSKGERRPATVVGMDIDSDLAVIKVDALPAGVVPVTLGDSSTLQVGQFVIAIGSPFGEAGSMTFGIISGLGRNLTSQRLVEGGGRYSLPQVIQTDAAINPGNSGGPLLNLRGEVIGVNSAILTRTGTNSGVGFSIPVNAVWRIAPALIANSEYVYPFMGIRMQDVTLVQQEAMDLPTAAGAYITDVSPGTPADEAGLIGSGASARGDALPGGDIILAINGYEINSTNDLIGYLVFETEVGQTVQLSVLRNGEEITVPLTLGARP